MAKSWQEPTGRINTKSRKFSDVVRDVRYCVYSVHRIRPEPIPGNPDQHRIWSLGSGFFVSPNVFLTCNHVINSVSNPHQAGDKYQLLQNLGNGNMKASPLLDLQVGQQLHLYPNRDAALITIQVPQQPYLAIGYNDIDEGTEIGVAGYPLSRVTAGPNGKPQFNNVVYRVARGVVTAAVRQNLNPQPDPQTIDLNTVEVNFLFVAGNSGGPIFDADTGRVFAYVHGYISPSIGQKYEDTEQILINQGAPAKHVENVRAIYSLGIRLDTIRQELEGFGVTL